MQFLRDLLIKMKACFPVILGMSLLLRFFFPVLVWDIQFATTPDNGSDMRYMFALTEIVAYWLSLLPIALGLLIIFGICRLHTLIELDSPGVWSIMMLSFAWLGIFLFLGASTAVPGGGMSYALGLLLAPLLIIIGILMILGILRVFFHMAVVSWRKGKANPKNIAEAKPSEE
jgi:hypothetical protein